MITPSIKSLSSITDNPVLLKRILTASTRAELETICAQCASQFTPTDTWLRQCYNEPAFHEVKLSMANDLLGTYGVEYIPHGHNSKSPAIEYCNNGDTYTPTLLFVNGNYRVGCWGDIVERGNYD